MQARQVAVATTSQGAAAAAAEICELGGNAVDCAIAAAMHSINTEPGVCALAGSTYVTVWPAGENPCTIDGNVAIPGMGLPADSHPVAESVQMEYGGGVETVIGAASVAVPGTPAALQLASDRFGRLPWHELPGPAIRAARDGFPLSEACHFYLQHSGDLIFGRSADGHAALHNNDGELLDARSNIVVPNLADSLALFAEEGSRVFYEGDIAESIAAHIRERDGFLTLEDLRRYQPLVRDSLVVKMGGWEIATNPPPAIGGAVLAAMLLAFDRQPVSRWDDASLHFLLRVQQQALSYRKRELDLSEDVPRDAAQLLELARTGNLLSKWSSGSTVHTSVVDDHGLACAITASSGYGSGEMPAGTGLWLNNCLGELELNRRGFDAGPPGARLPSNMAPSAARSGNAVLALGSPGAGRITTALHQFLINYIQLGYELAEAVAHPRMHFEIDGDDLNVAVEPGLDLSDPGFSMTRYPEIGMYFGGVVAALYNRAGFTAAADPRREGGTFVSPRGSK
jgi:gamma-glutamyltranspeptidase/glutathione hydrolase